MTDSVPLVLFYTSSPTSTLTFGGCSVCYLGIQTRNSQDGPFCLPGNSMVDSPSLPSRCNPIDLPRNSSPSIRSTATILGYKQVQLTACIQRNVRHDSLPACPLFPSLAELILLDNLVCPCAVPAAASLTASAYQLSTFLTRQHVVMRGHSSMSVWSQASPSLQCCKAWYPFQKGQTTLCKHCPVLWG